MDVSVLSSFQLTIYSVSIVIWSPRQGPPAAPVVVVREENSCWDCLDVITVFYSDFIRSETCKFDLEITGAG